MQDYEPSSSLGKKLKKTRERRKNRAQKLGVPGLFPHFCKNQLQSTPFLLVKRFQSIMQNLRVKLARTVQLISNLSSNELHLPDLPARSKATVIFIFWISISISTFTWLSSYIGYNSTWENLKSSKNVHTNYKGHTFMIASQYWVHSRASFWVTGGYTL